MKKTIVIFLGFVAFYAHGMKENKDTGNTYKDEIINAKNIKNLAPKLPQSHKVTQEFIEKRKDFLKLLASMPKPFTLESHIKNREEKQKASEESDLENKSKYNYVFQVPESNEWIQISGISNRLPGLKNAAYGIGKSYLIKNEDYEIIEENTKQVGRLLPSFFENLKEKLSNNLIPTYQTISRVANYLRLKQSIEKNNLTHVITVPTYLVHIPQQPEEISDENYIVVQDNTAEEIFLIRDNLQKLENVSEKALVDLYTAITDSGALWDTGGSNLYITKKDKFFIADLEQPNYSDPRLFYYKEGRDGYEFQNNVYAGIKGVVEQIKKLGEQDEESSKKLFNILKNLVTNDSELNNSKNKKYNDYVELGLIEKK